MKSTLPDETLKKIGVEKVRHFDVSLKDIRRFAQAIDDPDPIYVDETDPKKLEGLKVNAPPLFCQVFAFEDVTVDKLAPDGSPVEINVPLPAQKTVGGGSVYEVHGAVRPGDRITVKSQINDIYTKHGKSGQLYFIVVETEFYNQHNTLVAKETATFIKR